jgi:hypothetical protein
VSPGTGFDLEAPLVAEGVSLHPLSAAQRAALGAAAEDHAAIWSEDGSDDPAMPAGFDDLFDWLLEAGGGVCIEETLSGRAIGLFRIYWADEAAGPTAVGGSAALALGHGFLIPERWGDGSLRTALRPLLAQLFAVAPDLWFHLPPYAGRAQGAVTKLGAQRRADRILSLGPYGQPALWRRYVLSHSAWLANERLRALGVRPAATSG